MRRRINELNKGVNTQKESRLLYSLLIQSADVGKGAWAVTRHYDVGVIFTFVCCFETRNAEGVQHELIARSLNRGR